MPGCYAFRVKVSEARDVPEASFVEVSGSLTERSDLSFLSTPSRPHLVLDMGGVYRVNSGGVRQWVEAVREAVRQGTRLELVRCAPSVVRQLNMIANFVGNAVVRSVLAPYYCDQCGAEEELLIELQGKSRPEVPRILPCPGCKGTMEFDDLMDAYFHFIEYTQTGLSATSP